MWEEGWWQKKKCTFQYRSNFPETETLSRTKERYSIFQNVGHVLILRPQFQYPKRVQAADIHFIEPVNAEEETVMKITN